VFVRAQTLILLNWPEAIAQSPGTQSKPDMKYSVPPLFVAYGPDEIAGCNVPVVRPSTGRLVMLL
jgi:hypothetical protein